MTPSVWYLMLLMQKQRPQIVCASYRCLQQLDHICDLVPVMLQTCRDQLCCHNWSGVAYTCHHIGSDQLCAVTWPAQPVSFECLRQDCINHQPSILLHSAIQVMIHAVCNRQVPPAISKTS